MAESMSCRLGRESPPADGEDAVLAEALARRDPAVFDRLVETHHARVARLACRLLAWPQDVDDVVQEVFLAAWKALPRFRGQSELGTWLTRITINKCRSHRRKEMLRLRRLMRSKGRQQMSNAVSVDEMTLDAENQAQVRRAVRRLPARYCEVMVLRYLEEMPVEKISRVLGLTRNAVEVRLHRARERLKKELARMLEE
ncbi:MAG: RNA polymerase sigma factor [Phycisphaerae bacterium]